MNNVQTLKQQFSPEAAAKLLLQNPQADLVESFSFDHMTIEQIAEQANQAREAAVFWILAEDGLRKLLAQRCH